MKKKDWKRLARDELDPPFQRRLDVGCDRDAVGQVGQRQWWEERHGAAGPHDVEGDVVVVGLGDHPRGEAGRSAGLSGGVAEPTSGASEHPW